MATCGVDWPKTGRLKYVICREPSESDVNREELRGDFGWGVPIRDLCGITINLAPAGVRNDGLSFDRPIWLGMLKLEEKISCLILHLGN